MTESLSSQKFLSHGQWNPLVVGEVFEGFTVDACKPYLDSYFYRVSTPQGQAVLYETPAYFQPKWQNRVWQGVQLEMARQGLAGPTGPMTFQRTWQGLTLQYVFYPDSVWSLLQHPLAEQCWQAGVCSENELRHFYAWMRSIQQGLAAQGWINPSLALPNIVGTFESPLLLDWGSSVPLDNTLAFPRFLLGYHLPRVADAKASAKNKTLTLAWQAAYRTFLALLQGKSPRFWWPEPINVQALNRVITAEMSQWLEHWEQARHPEHWPDLPTQIYKDTVAEYRQASQHFHQGLDALHAGNFEKAKAQAKISAGLWSTDPWAHFLLARSAEALNDTTGSLDALKMAVRSQSVAPLWREKARLYLKQAQLPDAERCIKIALERVPEDDAAWYVYSQIAAQSKQWSIAEDAARRALRLRPLNSVYQKHLRQLLRYFGHPELTNNVPRFASGQAAHLTQSMEKKAAQLPLPEDWVQGPVGDHQAALKGDMRTNHVTHKDTAQAGFLKHFELPDLVLQMDFLSQKRLLTALNEAHDRGFLSLLHQSLQGTQGIAVYARQPGQNLQEIWERSPVLPVNEWTQLTTQAESLLQRLARQRVVHADISPTNVLWHDSVLTLVDYDNLHALDIQDRPERRAFRTTPEYSAPELCKTHHASLSVDRYSMALVLLQAATGIFPDLCRNWSRRDFSVYERYTTHLPAPVRSALLAACAWSPDQRTAIPFDTVSATREVPLWLQDLSQGIQSVAKANAADYETHQKALLDQESTALTYYHLAYHGERVGDLESAKRFARACLGFDPSHQGAHWVLASALCKQSSEAAALKILQQALSHTTEEPETYRLLLHVYCQQGKLELALAACQHLERCLPYHADARLERAVTLAYFGLQHQAAEVLAALPAHQVPEGLKRQIFDLEDPVVAKNIPDTVDA